MRPYAPAGSRCSTCSTRLTDSTYSCQSSVGAETQAGIALATETCASPCRWCSRRIVSSAVVWRDVRSSSTASRTADRPQAVLAHAMQELDDERRFEARRQRLERCRSSAFDT